MSPLLKKIDAIVEQLHDEVYCVVSDREQQLEKTLTKIHRQMSNLLDEADDGVDFSSELAELKGGGKKP